MELSKEQMLRNVKILEQYYKKYRPRYIYGLMGQVSTYLRTGKRDSAISVVPCKEMLNFVPHSFDNRLKNLDDTVTLDKFADVRSLSDASIKVIKDYLNKV